MISSKSAPALCYASSLGALSSWPAVIASPGRSRDRRTGPSGWPSRRHLTSLRDAPSPGPKAGDERWPTALNPTPYDIFGHPKDAPYSKHRFYELVKLYHPDRHSHTAHGMHTPPQYCLCRMGGVGVVLVSWLVNSERHERHG